MKGGKWMLSLLTLLSSSGDGERTTPDAPSSERLSCLYDNGTNPYFQREEVHPGDVFRDSRGRLLVKGCRACFALWSPETDGSLRILGRGCWSGSEGCDPRDCRDYEASGKSAPTESKLCCCLRETCNAQILSPDSSTNRSILLISLPETQVQVWGMMNEAKEGVGGGGPYPLISMGIVLVGLLSLVLISLLMRTYFRERNRKTQFRGDLLSQRNNNPELRESSKLLPFPRPRDLFKKIPTDELDVHFDRCLDTDDATFGTALYPGMDKATGSKVLVKVPGSGDSYENEAGVYERMKPHSSVSQLLYHSEKYSVRGISLDYVMIFPFTEQVSLASYLKENIISWDTLCYMLRCITDGLAHIHSDAQGYHRGSICHRNISSENLFVRRDLSVCLGNFSRGAFVSGGNVVSRKDDEEVPASSHSFRLGDPRYTAPELLEGTINFRDAETCFKQADVYSLSLVFWEISRRCKSLYQGSRVPDFERAFQRELGEGVLRPNRERMKVLVSHYKARPLFPFVWKDSNPAVQLLRETIEDSWDQEGEARLTAFCVRERVSELSPLWERYQKSKKNDFSPSDGNNNNSRTLFNSRENPSSNLSDAIKSDTVFHINDFSTPSSLAPCNVGGKANKNDNVLSNQRSIVKLQPYQGSNPCQERNLNLRTSLGTEEEDESKALILNSAKDSTPSRPEEVEEEVQSSLRISLNRSAPPIPYLQNPLSREESKGPSPFFLTSKENNRKRDSSRKAKKRGKSSFNVEEDRGKSTVIIITPKEPSNLEKVSNLDVEKSLLDRTHREF